MNPENIYFYSHNKGIYKCFSNFYPVKFKNDENIIFENSEQYFMYLKAKTFDPDNDIIIKKILKSNNPVEIKKLGRSIKNYDEEVWNKLRYSIMLDALRLKFNQNDDIKQILLSTGKAMLYEASPTDKIWGIGFTATDAIKVDKAKYGLNLLGSALMHVRKEINSQSLD